MKMGRPVLCITEDIVDRANERTMREVVYYRKGIAGVWEFEKKIICK